LTADASGASDGSKMLPDDPKRLPFAANMAAQGWETPWV